MRMKRPKVADVVQRVGQQDAVEIGDRPGRAREIAGVRRDAHSAGSRRNVSQRTRMLNHRVHDAVGRKAGGQGYFPTASITSVSAAFVARRAGPWPRM